MTKDCISVGIDISRDTLDIWLHPAVEAWRLDQDSHHLAGLVETLQGMTL